MTERVIDREIARLRAAGEMDQLIHRFYGTLDCRDRPGVAGFCYRKNGAVNVVKFTADEIERIAPLS